AHGHRSVRVWHGLRREHVVGFNENENSVRAVAWSPDGTRFASAGEDRSVMIGNVETNRRELLLSGHSTRVTGLAFSSDGKSLASADFDGDVIVWDLDQGRQRLRFSHPTNKTPIKCLIYSPNNRLIATSH